MKWRSLYRSGIAVLLGVMAVQTIGGENRRRSGGSAPDLVAAPAPSILLRSDALVLPVAGVSKTELRDTWGAPRSSGRQHRAIDIMAARGTPVLAATSGVVAKLFTGGAGGLTIYLRENGTQFMFYYAHLDRYAEGLKEGDVVERGDLLGYVGSTGNASPDAPHLHFSIERLPESGEWWKGEAINPYPILLSRGAEAGQDLR